MFPFFFLKPMFPEAHGLTVSGGEFFVPFVCVTNTRLQRETVPFWIVERAREIAELKSRKLERTSGGAFSASFRSAVSRGTTEILWKCYSCIYMWSNVLFFIHLASRLAHNCETTGKSDGCLRTLLQ